MPPKKTAPTAAAAEMKQRLSVVIAPAVLERAKNVTFWSPGATLGGLVEAALVAQLKSWRGSTAARTRRGRRLCA